MEWKEIFDHEFKSALKSTAMDYLKMILTVVVILGFVLIFVETRRIPTLSMHPTVQREISLL